MPVRDYDILIEEPSGATPRHGMIDELNATDAPDRLLNALAMRLKLLDDGGELRSDVRIILNQQDGPAKSPNNGLKGALTRCLLPGRFKRSAQRLAFDERSQIRGINTQPLNWTEFAAIDLLQDLLSDVRHPAQQVSSSRLGVHELPPNCKFSPSCELRRA